jgi:hypothetical protein
MVLGPCDRLATSIETLLSYPRIEGMTAGAIARNLACDLEMITAILTRLVVDGRLRELPDGRFRRSEAGASGRPPKRRSTP